MTNPALAAAYAHGPAKVFPGEPLRPASQATGRRSPLRALAAQSPFAADLARLLLDVVTPARWEPWNQYNDHRGYPSPRSVFPVDVAIAQADEEWPVDPVRRETIGPPVAELRPPVRLGLRRRPERMRPYYGEFADALVELETGHLIAALTARAGELGLHASADDHGITLRPVQRPAMIAPMPMRSSGFGPRGFAADPRPLPVDPVSDIAAALPPGRLRYRLAVHNVTGLADGWYDEELVLVRKCAAMAQVRDCSGNPESIIAVSGFNLALVITADVAGAVAEEGPGGYAALLRAAGGAAQSAGAVAARAGMFSRPVRSVNDVRLEAEAGAPAGHSLLYVVLAGRCRVRCFPYDLSPLEEPC
ncbi:MAG TPA: hypothetical protein VJ914_06560 [Pseudonocardiaceae bacterium]|nr:hypothetical protein [Pseudonocardiaceae bacterium]